MKHILFVLSSLLLFGAFAEAQVVTGFRLAEQHPDRGGLIGNGITDLLWKDSTLYAATGFGLNITKNEGESWETYTEANYGGKGGVSALTVADDGTIWIATGYDTTVQDDQNLAAGGGLRFKLPGSDEWVFIPQPKDAKTDTAGGMKPTTTHVQNITFDIALLDTQVWIASFGGGVRRSLDMGQTWEIITTDGKPFSSLNYFNHRGFSVMSENGNIWVGTADGISKSSDGGTTWERFRVRNQQPEAGEISGNWIIALAHNPWDNSVWAVTLSTGGDEFNSVSRTLDGGISWQNFLKDELSEGGFARAIAFHDSAVYVATEMGVFESVDGGESWLRFPHIIDDISGEEILSEKFYSVATAPLDGAGHVLWLGSADGLARTENNGYQWTIFRSFVSTRQRTEPAVYAYPNPFSPARGTFLRFQYNIQQATTVKIDIYNFAMEKVISLQEFEAVPEQNTFDRSAAWDGRDNNGRMVDNGVYFFRALLDGRKTWGKIVVIN